MKGVVLETGYQDLGVGRIRDLFTPDNHCHFYFTGAPEGRSIPGPGGVMESYPPGGGIVVGPEICHRYKTKPPLVESRSSTITIKCLEGQMCWPSAEALTGGASVSLTTSGGQPCESPAPSLMAPRCFFLGVGLI